MVNHSSNSLCISHFIRHNDLKGFLKASLARKLAVRLIQDCTALGPGQTTPWAVDSKVETKNVPPLAASGTEKIAILGNAFVESHHSLPNAQDKLAVEEVLTSDCIIRMVAVASERYDGSVDPSNALMIFKAKLGFSEDQERNKQYLYCIFETMMKEIEQDICLFKKGKRLSTGRVSVPKRPSPSESLPNVNPVTSNLDTPAVDDDVKPAKRYRSSQAIASDILRILEAGPSQRKPLGSLNVDKPRTKSKKEPKLFITKEFNASTSPNYPALPETSPYPVPVIEAIRSARLFAAHQAEINAAKAAQPSGRNRY